MCLNGKLHDCAVSARESHVNISRQSDTGTIAMEAPAGASSLGCRMNPKTLCDSTNRSIRLDDVERHSLKIRLEFAQAGQDLATSDGDLGFPADSGPSFY